MMIRQATTDDVSGILQVIQSVWSNDSATHEQIQSSLEQPYNRCLVVVSEDQRIAGFVDAFLTYAGDKRRWEVDLLAVLPEFQGRGLAKRLVEYVTKAGIAVQANVARALIRNDNVPSQRTFASSGYTHDPVLRKLLVSSQSIETGDVIVPDAELIPVDTFTYRGIWLEGVISKASLKAAQDIRSEEQRDVAGVVMPVDNTDAIEAALDCGYEPVGEFHWWLFDYQQ